MPDRDQQFQRNERNEEGHMNLAGQEGQPQDIMDLSNNSESGDRSGNETGRKSNRGFAAMSPERQRAIASEGGRAAHRQGVAHEWSSDEARQAGRKGGQTVSQNREHMSEIGRKGGMRSGSRRSNINTNEGHGE